MKERITWGLITVSILIVSYLIYVLVAYMILSILNLLGLYIGGSVWLWGILLWILRWIIK